MSAPVSKGPEAQAAFRSPTFYYGSAREGMRDLLQNLPHGHDQPRVLLPSYIGWSPREGSGVFDPIADLGLDAAFYRVHADLSTDLASLEVLADTREYDLLVVIHYFGRPEPRLAEIRAIADAAGLVLVEDMAHAFFSRWTSDLGTAGDVQLYSLHKMLPLQLGGMVSYRNRELVTEQRSSHAHLAAEILEYDWRLIARRRRKVFTTAVARLRGLPEHGSRFAVLWPELGRGEVPQSIPLRIVGGDRDGIYDRMNGKGFGFTSLYHTLIPEVTDPTALEMSRHIINMPCHQDVAPDQVAAMVEAFRDALRSS